MWVERPDGTSTFSSCLYPEQANVYLHYVQDTNLGTSKALLKVSATTILLETIEDLIRDDPYSQMTFRIQWSSCLSDLFYKEMDDILDNAALFGAALGAIARIYEALRKCEVDVGGLSRTHFIHFRPAGYGRGFIDNICDLFPEISTTVIFRTRVLESLHTNVSTCIETIRNSIEDLTARCGCINCGHETQDHSCHVAIFSFIRTVATTMAHTDIKTSINPSRDGLKRIYSDCARFLRPEMVKQRSRLIEFASGLPYVPTTSPGEHKNMRYFLLDSILQKVCRVSVSSSYQEEFCRDARTNFEPQCTAIVTNGVCL